jgi:hypothetical protein
VTGLTTSRLGCLSVQAMVLGLLLALAIALAGCSAAPDPQTQADQATLGRAIEQCCAAGALPDGRCAEAGAALNRLGVEAQHVPPLELAVRGFEALWPWAEWLLGLIDWR